MSPNYTLPQALEDQVYASVQGLLFFNSVTVFISALAFALSIKGLWDERDSMKKLGWADLLRNDAFQIRVLITLINGVALVYLLVSLILYMTLPDALTPDLCSNLTNWCNYLYAIFYEVFYIFLLKKAFVIYKTEHKTNFLYRLAMLIAFAGPVIAMPVFIGLNVSQGYGLILFGFCYDVFNNADTFIYYLVIILVLAFAYLYVFAAPIISQARVIKGSNASQALKLLNIAKKNAMLTGVSMFFQIGTAILFLVVTEIYTVEIIYVSQVATLVSLVDVSVSSICVMLMTNAWMPKSMRHIFKEATDSDSLSLHTTSPRPESRMIAVVAVGP